MIYNDAEYGARALYMARSGRGASVHAMSDGALLCGQAARVRTKPTRLGPLRSAEQVTCARCARRLAKMAAAGRLAD